MTSTLRDLQIALFEMLKVIDIICKDYDIHYSLGCGTALGAVRHHGFIPWDDDLDILFPRTEYERFLEIAPPILKMHGLTLQKEFTEKWPMFYSKVRKDNTTFIEDYIPKIDGIHHGIYIDIFPIDNLSDNKIVAEAQWNVFHMLVAKEMNKRGYHKTNSLIKKFAMAISPIFPEKPMREFVMLKNRANTKRVHCFLGAAIVKVHNVFPRSMFDEYVEIDFEGQKFSIVKNYDLYLKIQFGDYMKLPPEEERGTHIHALKFDLKKSYKDYQY